MHERTCLKLFVASPGDVPGEREHIRKAVARFNDELCAPQNYQLELIAWEHSTIPAHGKEPQQLIQDQLGSMEQYDLVVCVFWNRLGTPTSRAASGTLEEYLGAKRARGEDRHGPEIWLYFREQDHDSDRTLDARDQRVQVGRFQEAVRGEALSWTYRTLADFETVFSGHLKQWLSRRLPRSLRPPPRPPNWSTHEKGFFSKVETIHLHIDGGTNLPLVQSWAERFERRAIPTKVTQVMRFVAGPQRGLQDFAQTYRAHTPGDQAESLEYFTTSLIDAREFDVRTVVQETLAALNDKPGIVVELERVVAVVSDRGVEASHYARRPAENTVLFEPSTTFPIETHFLVDIAKASVAVPPSLQVMLDASTAAGIDVGGWFMFEANREAKWAYRSNGFAPRLPDQELLIEERRDLQSELARRLDLGPEQVEVKILVEQALGVWKTRAERRTDFKTVPELAQWEKGTLKHPNPARTFWVVAPNFLGDKSEEIHSSMLANLSSGVRYMYFLRSFADLLRWQKFKAELKRQVDANDIDWNLREVLIKSTTGRWRDETDCFIRNPHFEEREGFELRRSRSGEVSHGIPMTPDRVKSLVDVLTPLEEGRLNASWGWIPTANEMHEFNAYVALTKLDAHLEFADDGLTREYDLIIAEEVSKHAGLVARLVVDGYVLIFEDRAEPDARADRLVQVLHCLKRIAHSVGCASFPRHRILVDHDKVRRVIRAHGFDVMSDAIARGASVLCESDPDSVIVSRAVYARWASRESGETMARSGHTFQTAAIAGYHYLERL